MLRSTNDLKDCAIQATDGTIGHVKDFYFDDQAWVIRYLIVETGSWLASRRVLVSPIALGYPNWADKVLPVSMTQEQVRNSPDIDTDKPVSRQHEMQYLSYYNYPYYWGGAGLWGGEMGPNMIMPGYEGYAPDAPPVRPEAQRDPSLRASSSDTKDDPHLRSCNAVTGYHIHATDGDIGHVQGLLLDEQNWAIRYLVVDTSNWWLGRKVLIAPQWIDDISWADSKVSISLTRQAVQDAPVYNPAEPLSRNQEDSFFKHYGRPNYWDH